MYRAYLVRTHFTINIFPLFNFAKRPNPINGDETSPSTLFVYSGSTLSLLSLFVMNVIFRLYMPFVIVLLIMDGARTYVLKTPY